MHEYGVVASRCHDRIGDLVVGEGHPTLLGLILPAHAGPHVGVNGVVVLDRFQRINDGLDAATSCMRGLARDGGVAGTRPVPLPASTV